MKLYLKSLTIFLSYSISLINLSSQELPTIFNPVSISGVELSANDSLYTTNIISNSDVVSHTYINVNNVFDYLQDGNIKFIFSIDSILDTIDAYTVDVSFMSEDEYVWKGEIPKNDGGILITKKTEGISGSFFYDSFYYEIFSINDSISLITQYDPPLYEIIDDLDSTNVESPLAFNCEGDGCAALITILVLITPDAASWLVDPNK